MSGCWKILTVRVANFRLCMVPAQVYYIDHRQITQSNSAKSLMTENDRTEKKRHTAHLHASQDDSALQARPLIATKPVIINIGLEDFARELASQGVEVLHTNWQPPCGGDKTRGNLLSRLG